MDTRNDAKRESHNQEIGRRGENAAARYLELFGAIEIADSKWSGKTWTAREHGASIIYIDEGSNLTLASSGPLFATLGERLPRNRRMAARAGHLGYRAPRGRRDPSTARGVNPHRLLVAGQRSPLPQRRRPHRVRAHAAT